MKKLDKTVGALFYEGYDVSVAARMIGRSGAKTIHGGKGIAFEILYADKKNIINFLKGNGRCTRFTKSSTAKQVDLVTMKVKKVVERIQCKDTPSQAGLAKTMRQAKNGKYKAVQYVGTKETAHAYNAKAAEKGISKIMKDSGISTKDTSRISHKFNGITSATGTGSIVLKSAKLGGTISGGVAAVESFVKKDDLGTAAANITSNGLNGAFSSGAATATTESVMAAIAVAPIPLAAKAVIGMGSGIMVGGIVSEVSEDFCEGVGDITGSFAESAGDIVLDMADTTRDIVGGVGDFLGLS